MNNEPVAWIDKSKLDDWLHGDCYPDQCFIHYQANDAIPLYTHPVKEQDESFDRTASHMAGEYVAYKAELTDEEIRHIQAQCHLKNVGYDNFIMRFARAILRKAQEKTTQSVMAEHCTCYKLGYSPLNDYALIKQK